jgi:hypothetical protein
MADGDYTELLAILVRLADDHEHALDLLDKTLGASGPPITLAGEGMDYARSRVRLWRTLLTCARLKVVTMLDEPRD